MRERDYERVDAFYLDGVLHVSESFMHYLRQAAERPKEPCKLTDSPTPASPLNTLARAFAGVRVQVESFLPYHTRRQRRRGKRPPQESQTFTLNRDIFPDLPRDPSIFGKSIFDNPAMAREFQIRESLLRKYNYGFAVASA
jgi:hypothetical protein